MKRLTVIGLGLIGASCCAALKKRSTEWLISGCSRTEATRQQALAKGLIDQSFDRISDAVADADLVLIAVPMGQFLTVVQAVSEARPDHSVVTDAGSTKGSVIRDLATVYGTAYFHYHQSAMIRRELRTMSGWLSICRNFQRG